MVVFAMNVPVYAISYAVIDSSVSFGCATPPIGSSLPTALTTSGNGAATSGRSAGGRSGASLLRSCGEMIVAFR